MIVVERVDAARVALAADLEDRRDLLQRVVEARVAEHRQDDAELLGAEGVVPCRSRVSSTMRKRRSSGICEACSVGEGLGRDRDRVRGAVALVVPQDRSQPLTLLAGDDVAAFLDQAVAQRVVDRGLDHQVAVGRAARSEVGGLAEPRVARRLGHVRGLIDDHRRVAGADAVGRHARAVGRLDHVPTAGRLDQVGPRHQVLGGRDARSFEALQQVLGRALAGERAAHDLDRLPGRPLAARMGREDDRVAALDHEQADARWSQLRIRGRHQRGERGRPAWRTSRCPCRAAPRSRRRSSGAGRRAGCPSP